MQLMIVESPAKAKTIEKYLGKDFVVKSSYGHIRDLEKNDKGIDIKNGFKPAYIVSSDKSKVVKELKDLVKKSNEVWLATDEDREGEAISWHLCEVLGLDPHTTKRVTFNEITKPAIQKAISSPRTVNLDLVNAQQARRILDRLVGFEISPILWRKVKGNLSAGRVQSVAVRIIVEREDEIAHFKSESSFKVQAVFTFKDKQGKEVILKAEASKNLKSEAEVQQLFKEVDAANFSIQDIQSKEATRKPASPFTTSTLQQEAGRKLYFSVSKTMSVAQRLYEAGHISYMRTDSTNLSETALAGAKEAIESEFGNEYHQRRTFKTKSDNAQEAHEAIRPTNMKAESVSSERDEQRLYDLIRKRTLASQMADAKLERTTITISANGVSSSFQAKGEVILFEGFLKMYLESHDDEEDDENSGLLPPVAIGQELNQQEFTATQKFSRPPSRFTEPALVKKLEELGIGRPSTYAATISTIQKRGYVEKGISDGVERNYAVHTWSNGTVSAKQLTEKTGSDKGKLVPTDIGILVNEFLVEHFSKILDYNFTAKIEDDFDQIAKGKRVWVEMLEDFYTPFHENVEETIETATRVTGERNLGNHPDSGEPIIARMGRFGPLVQIGDGEDPEKKPKFASLRANQHIHSITLEEALELFKLPREIGEFEGKMIKAAIGRFGPYLAHNSAFYSLKEDDPHDVDLERSIQIIEQKRADDLKKILREFEGKEYRILMGRWGPFLKNGKENIKLPKGREPESFTEEELEQLIADHIPKGGKKTAGKRTAGKKTASAGKKTAGKKTAGKKTAGKKTK